MRSLRILVLVMLGPLLLALAGTVHPAGLSAATAHRWVQLHVVLLPVFPLLALGFPVLLRGRPHFDVPGVATVVAWCGAAVYGVGYTALDAVAGIAAGTVAGGRGDPAQLRASVLALYDIADRIGHVGVYALLTAVLAGTVALWSRHGWSVLPGSVVLFGSGVSFLDSHIFWPRGVFTMLAMALGFALWVVAAAASVREARGPLGEPF